MLFFTKNIESNQISQKCKSLIIIKLLNIISKILALGGLQEVKDKIIKIFKNPLK